MPAFDIERGELLDRDIAQMRHDQRGQLLVVLMGARADPAGSAPLLDAGAHVLRDADLIRVDVLAAIDRGHKLAQPGCGRLLVPWNVSVLVRRLPSELRGSS